ncbi:MAG: LTA synthase family protein, partial [Flavobacteriales bacterium]
ASKYSEPAYMPLVLNTPFTFMTSIGKPLLEEKHYMSPEEAERLWPVVHQYGGKAMIGRKPNVVTIILESFSAAYSAKLTGTDIGYMPFLDSLMGQSLWFTHAYANGRRSIDGIPAVTASMPKLMPEAFIESIYAQQPITTLPSLLDAEGYSTSFFHGGHNGTMGFDAFAKSAGFERYVGRDEYPDDADDDGVWGIRDRPFFQFYAQQLNKEKQPFMSCIFSLSSHHPYKLPETEAKRFSGGVLPIMPTLRYADDALRQFFATAEKMPWFRNTIFIITADHTADLLRDGQASGSAFDHWVPLIFFMPSKIAPRKDDQVAQQIDILPTVMDMIGYPKPFFAFGSSVLRDEGVPSSVSENSATWLIIGDSAQVRSDGKRVLWSAPLRNGIPPDSARMDSLQHQVQAAIQQYNFHLLHRDMVLKAP